MSKHVTLPSCYHVHPHILPRQLFSHFLHYRRLYFPAFPNAQNLLLLDLDYCVKCGICKHHPGCGFIKEVGDAQRISGVLRRVKGAHYEYMIELPQNVEFYSNFLPKLWMFHNPGLLRHPQLKRKLHAYHITP